MMKGRGAMTTKIMGQDDTNTDNEGIDNNTDDDRDQGMKPSRNSLVYLKFLSI